jgi:hypothetical protein
MNYKFLIIIKFCINNGYLVKDDGLLNKTCIDHDCPAFVQVSPSVGLGGRISPVSIYDGPQYEIDILIFKVPMLKHLFFLYFFRNAILIPGAYAPFI